MSAQDLSGLDEHGQPPPARRLRIALISSPDHLDYDLAFAEALTDHCDLMFCGPLSLGDEIRAVVKTTKVVLLRWPRHRQVWGNLVLLANLSSAIARFKPDVVHVLSEGQVWLNLLPILIRQVPMVVTLHDVQPHPGDEDTARVPRALVHRFARRAAAIIVHGEGLRVQAAQILKTSVASVFTGTHPLINRYRALADAMGLQKPADDVFRILFFGRIYRYKGLMHLIEAERMIAADVSPRLTVIAGRGDDMAPYRGAMADPVRFEVRNHRIADEETAFLFAAADLLVLPYVEASQSGVLMIAATFDLPVVASDVGEIGALLKETGMGVLVPPAKPSALAEAIQTLARQPSQRAAMSAKARQAALGRLSHQTVWAQVEQAYRWAIQSRGRTG